MLPMENNEMQVFFGTLKILLIVPDFSIDLEIKCNYVLILLKFPSLLMIFRLFYLYLAGIFSEAYIACLSLQYCLNGILVLYSKFKKIAWIIKYTF